MGPVPIRPGGPGDREWIRETLEQNWGGSLIVVHDVEFDCLNLPSLIAGDQDGLLLYRIAESAEIILLHTRVSGSGLGSALIKAFVEQARAMGVFNVRVTTTNDNVEALRFYQRFGFRLTALRPGAVRSSPGSQTVDPAIRSQRRPGTRRAGAGT